MPFGDEISYRVLQELDPDGADYRVWRGQPSEINIYNLLFTVTQCSVYVSSNIALAHNKQHFTFGV